MNPFRLTLDRITQLWRIARQWCVETCAALGGPAAVARAVTRETYAAARRRIAFLEAFVLKLLLVEASCFPPPLPAAGRDASAAARRAHTSAPIAAPITARRARTAEQPTNPETWRVRFQARLAPARHAPQPQARPRVRAPVHAHPRPHARARTLARRFEALRRIIADPRCAVAALARRLTRLGDRAQIIAYRIALARPRQGGGPTFAEAIVHAVDAAACWRPNTS